MLIPCFKIKTCSILAVFIVVNFVTFVSCQRELSPDPQPVSTGNLSKDTNNNCQPVAVSGNYIKGVSLNDSNYLEADVNITSPGSYNIITDTINGYYFKSSGTFSTTGHVTIKLPGFGNPVISDTNYFTINYNGSLCQASVIVTDTAIHNATFTLAGAPDTCINAEVYGTYVIDVPLDTNAKVKISINVITPGTFTIATNTANGYSFSASGTLTQTGIQTVFLNASGTPIVKGKDVFVVNTGTSVCNFPVDVLTTIIVFGNDYFPLSGASYWTYDDMVNVGDSIKETVDDSITINNNLYKIMKEEVRFGGPYQYFYRKSGSDYFEYAAPNKYTTFFQYKNPVYADIPFLKENLSAGGTWESPEYTDTASNGDVIVLKYDFTCLSANAIVTVNGKAFMNVYEIKMRPLVKQTGSYEYTGEEYLFYYAKGIGLIYIKKTLDEFVQKELQIRNWKVY